MKKFLSVISLLLILLLPFSAFAGTSVTLNTDVSTSSGQTTIRWAPGDMPSGGYKVYVSAVNPYASEEMVQLAGSTTGNSLTTGLMVPNTTYKVYVTDTGNRILGTATYTMGSVPTFQDGKLKDTSVKVSTELRRLEKSTQKHKKIKAFKSSEMESVLSQGTAYFCMKYLMRMPQLAKPRTFFVQLVFESPNGYTYTDKATDITFDRVSNGYQTIWWEYAGADFFSNLYSQTGSIPTGRYTMTLYWDGCYVNTSTFNVN